MVSKIKRDLFFFSMLIVSTLLTGCCCINKNKKKNSLTKVDKIGLFFASVKVVNPTLNRL